MQEEVDLYKREMALEKGRQILKDVGVLIYSGWDMRSALLFDGFPKKQDPNKRIMPEEIDKIFMGLGYDPDQKALIIWALYLKEKRPILVDTDQVFGHLMVQRVGKIDPRIIAKLNVDVEKLNQEQKKFLVKENSIYKGLYEKATKEVQRLQGQLSQTTPIMEDHEPVMGYQPDLRVLDAISDATY